MFMTNTRTWCWNLVNATTHPTRPPPPTNNATMVIPMLMSYKSMPMSDMTLPRYTTPLKLQNVWSPPLLPTMHARVTIIEFAFCHDRDPIVAISKRIDKYNPLITSLIEYGWIAPSLLVVTAGYRGGVHTHNLNTPTNALQLPTKAVKTCLRSLHLTAIKSLFEARKPHGI